MKVEKLLKKIDSVIVVIHKTFTFESDLLFSKYQFSIDEVACDIHCYLFFIYAHLFFCIYTGTA